MRNMDRYQVSYSALPTLAMSDENSISPLSYKAGRNVNFPPETSDVISAEHLEGGGGARRGSRFLQRPRSLSVWSTSSVISRTSNRFDER